MGGSGFQWWPLRKLPNNINSPEWLLFHKLYYCILRASTYVRPSPLQIGKWALDFIAGTLDSVSMINFCEFNDTATWETGMTSCVELNSNFGFPIEPRRL